MTKQDYHKMLVVSLLLAVFAVPFYLERNQISSLNDSAYMVGAVIQQTDTSTQAPQPTLAGSSVSGWASVIGDNFVGAQVK